jgi:sugar fermentation stimulation protein A
MKYPPLIRGRFINRDNRFRATVLVDGVETWAHVPNSGRLQEIFQLDRPVWLVPAGDKNRVTSYDLKLVEFADVLVSVDARLPNPLFEEALTAGELPEFDYPTVRREVSVGESRLDFKLSAGEEICWVETKSVTLVVDEVAHFPDAPTDRGRRHLLELIDLKGQGARTVVVFVVQRPDALSFMPNTAADPRFTSTLIHAAGKGVEIHAYRCTTSLEEIVLEDEIPVHLTG